MEAFKNKYNKKSVEILSNTIADNAGNKFNQKRFLKNINSELLKLEMKDRVRLISNNLYKELPYHYSKNIDVLVNSLADENKENGITGFMTWPLLQYVEDFGLENFDSSFKAMYEMTKRFSAEFAIRPFLIKDDKKVFQILEQWKSDNNKHIRRLCSEGTRPNLPWGMKVPIINNNLSRNIRLISSLKDDTEEYVRRSVANHLNDISRLDQKLMLSTAKDWSMKNPNKDRNWIIRHATRSLLKQGHQEALKLHGYNPRAKIRLKNFKLDKKKIVEGDNIELDLAISNENKSPQNILIEYVIHFLKKDGTHSKKPFRLKDGKINPNETLNITKDISFRKVTTRKHYKGKHFISIQINGKEYKELSFTLS